MKSTLKTGYSVRTAVHADIDGFSKLIAGMDASEVAQIFTNVFSNLSGLANHFQGNIVGFEGDGLTVDFALPENAMQFALAAKSLKLPEIQGRKLSLSCGVSTSDVFASEIPGPDAFFVVGPAISQAHALETYAAEKQIIIDKRTFEKLGESKSRFSAAQLIGGKYIAAVAESEENLPDNYLSGEPIDVLTYTSPRLKSFYGKPKKEMVTTSVVTLDHISRAIQQRTSPEKVEQMIDDTFNVITETIGEKGHIGSFSKRTQIIYDSIRSPQEAIINSKRLLAELAKFDSQATHNVGIEKGITYIGEVCANVTQTERGTNILGEPVNLAYELCQFLQSQDNQERIALGQEVHNRVSSFIESVPVLGKQFKGFAPDTPAFILLRIKDTPSEISESEVSLEEIFIDREKELEQLYKTLESLKQKEGTATVSISGEGGIGKTALLGRFEEEISKRGYEVIHAKPLGYEYFSLFRPFLSPVCISRLEGILTSNRDEASQIMEGNRMIYEDMNKFQNTILCIDDIDRADDASLTLLRELKDSQDKRNLMIVYTQSKDKGTLKNPDLEITLSGLDSESSVEYAEKVYERIYGHELSKEIFDKMRPAFDASMGNPLALRELLFNPHYSGSDAKTTVEDILAYSFSSFPDDKRNLVGMLALNDRQLPTFLISGIDDDPIRDLISRQIIDKVDGYVELRNRDFGGIAQKMLTANEKELLRKRILTALKGENTSILERKADEKEREKADEKEREKADEKERKYYRRVSREIDVNQLNWMLDQSLALEDITGSYDLFRIAGKRIPHRDIIKKGNALLSLLERNGYLIRLKTSLKANDLVDVVNQEDFTLWSKHGAVLTIMGNSYKNTYNSKKMEEMAEGLDSLCSVFPEAPSPADSQEDKSISKLRRDLYSRRNAAFYFSHLASRWSGRAEHSRKIMQSALELAVTTSISAPIWDIYTFLGNTCSWSSNYSEAVEFFDLAEQSLRDGDLPTEQSDLTLGGIRSNKAFALIASGENLDTAEHLVNEVIATYTHLSDSKFMLGGKLAEAYLTRAELYLARMHQNSLEDTSRESFRKFAIQDALKARDLSEEAYYPKGIAIAALKLSLLAPRTDAEKHYRKALGLINTYSLPEQEFINLDSARERFEK